MVNAVADASVVIKWFAEEEHSDRARELLEDFVDHEVDLLAPALLRYEVLNGVRWKKGTNAVALQKVDGALQASGMSISPMEGTLSRSAIHMALKYGITVYDAVYLALAVETGDCTFWSADDRLLKKLDEDVPAHHIKDYRGKRGGTGNGNETG